MELKQLQSFCAVVKYKSFTTAADKLYVSQPTISTHIRQLEEELGETLVRRTTKNLEITAKGLEIAKYASDMIELKDRIYLCCEKNQRKIIHLGASTIPSGYILPKLLPEFGKMFPEIYFVIHQSDSAGIIEGLKSGTFDVGLIGMDAEYDTIRCIPFEKDRMVLITPVEERYLELPRTVETAVELLKTQPVILREKGSGSQKSADRFLDRIGINQDKLHLAARLNDQEAIKKLVEGGLGISMISEKAAKNYIDEKRLLTFPLTEQGGGRTFFVAYRKDMPIKQHIKSFVNFVLSQKNS